MNEIMFVVVVCVVMLIFAYTDPIEGVYQSQCEAKIGKCSGICDEFGDDVYELEFHKGYGCYCTCIDKNGQQVTGAI